MTTCLIVDDSKTIRRIIRDIMDEIGFSSDEAENGQIACDLCKVSMPDVIMLDWNMPVMDGPECMLKIRAMENGAHPKIIFCTTENDMNFIQRAMQSGADEYIMKPFDRSVIEIKYVQLGLLEEQDMYND